MDPSDLASTSTIPNPTQFRSTPIFNSRSSTATLRTSNTTDNPTNPPSAGGSSSAVPIEAPIEWECGICMEVPSSFGLLGKQHYHPLFSHENCKDSNADNFQWPSPPHLLPPPPRILFSRLLPNLHNELENSRT